MASRTINASIRQADAVSNKSIVAPANMFIALSSDASLSIGNGSTAYSSLPKAVGSMRTGVVYRIRSKSIPVGCLACNGQAVSRTTYSRLYNIIGTKFGAGNGSTTFNLPNLTNRFSAATSSYSSMGAATDASAHNHGGGDIHAVIGAWGSMTDTMGYQAVGSPGLTCAYGVRFRYFMDDPKSPSQINHATDVWNYSDNNSAWLVPLIYTKYVIKY